MLAHNGRHSNTLWGSLVEFFLERYVLAVMPFIFVLTPTPVAALMRRWRPGE